MLTRLVLENFKNFQKAELPLGPLTLMVGTNASGKSNLRDAFRFLHGIARGYSLPDIFGGKNDPDEGQWGGIRGGIREIAFDRSYKFSIESDFKFKIKEKEKKATYFIQVGIDRDNRLPSVKNERLTIEGEGPFIFKVLPTTKSISRSAMGPIDSEAVFNLPPDNGSIQPMVKFKVSATNKTFVHEAKRPIICAIKDSSFSHLSELTKLALKSFGSMRFIDLDPDAMRKPSLPGQTVLGDHGENLSSVLYAICEDKSKKKALLHWLQELTPMDAKDFEFPADQTGKILVSLVEENGQKISAHSASDGTLRFLAMLAALLGPEPARFYFFEELENGIHPTRLHLLLDLIEHQVEKGRIQIVVTTHSPNFLGLLSEKNLPYASLTYRLPGQPDARIKRILDIPQARKLIKNQGAARLLDSGWFEDVVDFLSEEESA